MRTTYEYLVPYKSSYRFCLLAEEDGSVESVTDELITIKYKSGETKAYPVGTSYGEMEGSAYAHNLKVEVKKGQRLKKNDIVAYHEDFFERDWLDNNRLISKTTTLATVALTITPDVYEDSSAVSTKFANELKTSIVYKRNFILDFDTNLVNLIKVGEKVDPNTVLFTGLDDSSDTSNLSEQSLTLLQNLASHSPRARFEGTVDRIEIKYNGDKEDMSPSVRTLATRLDRELLERTRGTPYEARNNKVSREYRSSGKSLELDTFELTVYIKTPLGLGNGDKVVFNNNMKSVVSHTWDGSVMTESGDELDAMFGYLGVIGRIVNSPYAVGMLSRLSRLRSKQIAEEYFK